MKNIDLWNYNENDGSDKEKWEVYSEGVVGSFFNAISDDKYFEDDRDNPVYMGGERHAGVEDQAGKFVMLPKRI